MKKIILLFVAILAFSCSSDDKQTSSPDPILGTWKPITQIILDRDTNQEQDRYEVCNQKTRLTYLASGTLSNIIAQGNNLSECMIGSVPNVTWYKNGNSLSVTFPGVGEQISNVTFSNNNNNMKEVAIDGNYTITTTYIRE